LLDSEFMDMEASSSVVERVASVIAPEWPVSPYSADGGSLVPWVAVWALTTLGGSLLAYAVACGLMA